MNYQEIRDMLCQMRRDLALAIKPLNDGRLETQNNRRLEGCLVDACSHVERAMDDIREATHLLFVGEENE